MEFSELCERAFSVVAPRKLSETAEAGTVGAALETDSGNVYVGVCMDISCSIGFCAEHAAAAAMVTAGENRVVKMVAVNRDGVPIPPCGRCRELITSLHPENREALVLVEPGTILPLKELLPFDWKKTEPPC